ncbi:MAG: hypothetical protein K1V80_07910 [Muribaculaceae bacterium]
MKYLIIVASLIAMLISSCSNKEQATGQQSLMEASKQELAAALEERDQLLAIVKEITVSMDQIKHLERIMSVAGSQSLEKPDQRAQLLSDMAAVKEALKQRRNRLVELENRLQESALYTDDLKSTIEALRNQIDGQSLEIEGFREQLLKANEHINTLNKEVDSLNTTVENVNNSLDEAQATSARLENELNTCYYVVATKSQLKEHHIIETGFLRKSKLLKGDFDNGFFTTGDKRKMDTLDLRSNKVKIFTNHPEDSYIIEEVDKNKILTITNHEKFWSLSNYLVVQIE